MTAKHAQRLWTWLNTCAELEDIDNPTLATAVRHYACPHFAPGSREDTLLILAQGWLQSRRPQPCGPTEERLAADLLEQVWTVLPLMTPASDVVSEVIDRLERGCSHA